MTDIATRAVHIAGTTPNPNSEFMAQVARNLTDHVDGYLRDKRYLILDNDVLFTAQFKCILGDASVKAVPTAYRAPNRNSFAERWVRSIKSECLSRIIPFGSRSLERAISDSAAHYNSERPHLGLRNKLINEEKNSSSGSGEVIVSERLGGLLKHYHRSAA